MPLFACLLRRVNLLRLSPLVPTIGDLLPPYRASRLSLNNMDALLILASPTVPLRQLSTFSLWRIFSCDLSVLIILQTVRGRKEHDHAVALNAALADSLDSIFAFIVTRGWLSGLKQTRAQALPAARSNDTATCNALRCTAPLTCTRTLLPCAAAHTGGCCKILGQALGRTA